MSKDNDYIKKKAQERKRRRASGESDEAIERRLVGEAEYAKREAILNSQSDDDVREFRDMFGAEYDKIVYGVDKKWYPEEVAQAVREVKKSMGKKSLFGGSIAKRKMKQRKKELKQAKKIMKRKKWFW